MGCPLTKELLHYISYVSSISHFNISMIDEIRLLLGDDIFCLNLSRKFYDKILCTGLKTNVDKEESGLFVNITDRIVSLYCEENHGLTFRLISPDTPPPKLYSLYGKYTMGINYFKEQTRLGVILKNLVSADLTTIKMNELFYQIYQEFYQMAEFSTSCAEDSDSFIPYVYGGNMWPLPIEEKEYAIAHLWRNIEFIHRLKEDVTFYVSERTFDGRKSGFLQVSEICFTMEQMLPGVFSHLTLNNEINRNKKDIAIDIIERVYTTKNCIIWFSPKEIYEELIKFTPKVLGPNINIHQFVILDETISDTFGDLLKYRELLSSPNTKISTGRPQFYGNVGGINVRKLAITF